MVEVGFHEERRLVCDMKWVGPLDFRWVRFLMIMMTIMVIMMTILMIFDDNIVDGKFCDDIDDFPR